MKKLCIILLLFICATTFMACASLSKTTKDITNDATDQLANIADKENLNVLGVKNGHPEKHPDITYDSAFGSFFGSPTWKYFESTEKEAIVEFTGMCNYDGIDVNARLQFVLDKNSKYFEVYALSFNDITQNEVIKESLLEKVFSSARDKKSVISKATPIPINPIKRPSFNYQDLYQYIGLSKEALINKLGTNYETAVTGVDGCEEGYKYTDLGLTFSLSTIDGKVTTIYCDETIVINGARAGMSLSEISEKLGSTTIEESWIGSPENIILTARYTIGNNELYFFSPYKDGSKANLWVTKKENPKQQETKSSSIESSDEALSILQSFLENMPEDIPENISRNVPGTTGLGILDNEIRDGKEYYVIRHYSDMGTHISVINFYCIEKETGKLYVCNVSKDTLIPITTKK